MEKKTFSKILKNEKDQNGQTWGHSIANEHTVGSRKEITGKSFCHRAVSSQEEREDETG